MTLVPLLFQDYSELLEENHFFYKENSVTTNGVISQAEIKIGGQSVYTQTVAHHYPNDSLSIAHPQVNTGQRNATRASPPPSLFRIGIGRSTSSYSWITFTIICGSKTSTTRFL